MTNNFKTLRDLLDFSKEGTFYYLQLLRRKKDNPGNKSAKVIKNYYIENEEYFDRKEEEIKNLCNKFNARAYLRLNRRSYEDVAYQLNYDLANSLKNKQYKHVSRLFSKACGRTHCEDPKIWVVDIDKSFEGVGIGQTAGIVADYIEELQAEIQQEYKILKLLPTVNGFHILTNPFNVKKFTDKYPKQDIHKDNPTILYAP